MNKNAGFTLIELLVVVLIIGILASVALPSYNKAVEKSQAVEGVTLLKSLIESVSRYDLANKECPSDVEELDIDIPSYTDSSGNTYKGGKYFKIHNIGQMGNMYYCSVVLRETKTKYGYYFQAVVDRRDGKFKRYCLWNPVINIGGNNIDGYPAARKPNTTAMEQMCNAITGGHNTDGLW